MIGYVANFAVYTMAMIGLICFALFVYKKFTVASFGKKSEFLDIEDTINLAPRKNLYVVRAGSEKFLVAADVDRTSLIAKLDEDSKPILRQDKQNEELPIILDFEQKPVMKEMMRKISKL